MTITTPIASGLRLRVCGGVSLDIATPRAGGGVAYRPPDAPLGMKALAMIAYLADVAPRTVRRDAIVDLLWERVGPAQGRGSLRQELRRIKRALGDQVFADVFEIADAHIGLVDTRLDYDVARVEAAALAEDAEGVAPILRLYRGEFLSENAARADAFQSWARARREALNGKVAAALARLSRLDLEAGRLPRAQEAADRIIAMDALHEAGHECLIRCHVASGRRGQARAHFERFRKMMLRELGEEPSAALAALVTPEAPAPAPRRAHEIGAGAAPGGRGASGAAARPTIAVLDVSPHAKGEQAYLATGVVEELIANLSRSTWIRVASLHTAPMTGAKGEVDHAQRDLRGFADYLLRVDMRLADDRATIIATLSRVADKATVFSDRMEDRFEDLLALQRRIALRIASIFEPMVLEDQSALAEAFEKQEPKNFDHWRLLMRARWLFWTTTKRNNAAAKDLLRKAMETDANDVPTLCLMAFAHMMDGWADWTGDVSGAVAEAQRWAARAVEVAPYDGWAHFTLAMTSSTHRTLPEAKRRMAHALELAPSLVIAMGETARFHVFMGEPGPALSIADEALARSPYDQQSGLWIRTKAIARWLEGDLHAALELTDYALIVRPAWFQNHLLRAAILAEMGDIDEAALAYGRVRERIGAYSLEAMRLGHPFQDDAHFNRFVAALNKIGAPYGDR